MTFSAKSYRVVLCVFVLLLVIFSVSACRQAPSPVRSAEADAEAIYQRLKAEEAAAERIAREKLAVERIVRERLEAERQAREREEEEGVELP